MLGLTLRLEVSSVPDSLSNRNSGFRSQVMLLEDQYLKPADFPAKLSLRREYQAKSRKLIMTTANMNDITTALTDTRKS